MFGINNIAILGKSIFCVKHDDALIKSFKEQKSIEGSIVFPNVKIYTSPLYFDNKYKGIMAIYREEKTTNDKEKVVQLETSNTKKIVLNDCFKRIIAKSNGMKKVLWTAQKASKVSSTVLIRGESGTGKELVAKAIHDSSSRKDKPFIKVNCGAIPSNLLESELFGHEQGAFTGAIKRKIGKFEQADGGTIFLDEIGDMPLEMQVKLLRVIQEKELERVGGIETISCDVRILSATHHNLERRIEQQQFRKDLYYRLNVISINLPPLRERREDITLLCSYLTDKINKKNGGHIVKLSKDVEKAFYHYDWPGNVRELENLIEGLVALAEEEVIDLEEIPSHISNVYQRIYSCEESSLIHITEENKIPTLEEYEREIIKMALERFGSFNAAGKALGVTHKTIAAKARKYNIID
ncbi:hypothetical protein BJL90_08800 [Clostridium formicaceticum]|uniref:HTH-type transcriptional regulatory protein TyrR n=1 Tax=Clostridium formicaceticum TaxID=1497 RepID=A0ABN4TEQ2_9CLOT|nr:hypothetical protein BJL90_08800 [Clostridium formicaceticum]